MTPEEAFARQHTVLNVRTGSQLYGTNLTDTPDNDEMGIFVEPRASVFSAEPLYVRPRTVSYRTARAQDGSDLKSTAGDVDGQLLSMDHFIRSSAKGNPNTLTILFAPGSAILNQIPRSITTDLRLNRERFITKRLGQRYLGYLDNQRKLYLDNPKVKRPELVDQFGFDTKGAYHGLRVAIQGIELMTTGWLHLPMKDHHREYLKAVRRGEFSKEQVREHLVTLEDMLRSEIITSKWPDFPNYRLLTDWNYRLHTLYWDYQRQCESFPV